MRFYLHHLFFFFFFFFFFFPNRHSAVCPFSLNLYLTHWSMRALPHVTLTLQCLFTWYVMCVTLWGQAHTNTYTHSHTPPRTRAHTLTHAATHACTHTHTHTHKRANGLISYGDIIIIHTHIHVHTLTLKHTNARARKYAHTHICIHTAFVCTIPHSNFFSRK